MRGDKPQEALSFYSGNAATPQSAEIGLAESEESGGIALIPAVDERAHFSGEPHLNLHLKFTGQRRVHGLAEFMVNRHKLAPRD